jgi:hypothetical protein
VEYGRVDGSQREQRIGGEGVGLVRRLGRLRVSRVTGGDVAPLLAAAAIAATPPALRRNAFGILAGAAYIPLWVAWVNRQGPCIVRWHAVNSGGWQTESDPKPWLLAGLTLIAVAVAGQILIHRHLRRRGAEPVQPR